MFIFLESDHFEARSRKSGSSTLTNQTGRGAEWAAIRRPYRGIQIKKDTYAVISVRTPDGFSIPLVSSSAVDQTSDPKKNITAQGAVAEYSDFILQRVEESREEKTQVIPTFGESFAYFFGEKPRFVTFQGLLMNTEDFNWRAQFWLNYERYLRGSKLVERNARCYIAYDTIVVEGYPINATAIDTADDPYTVPFTMTMLMTNYHEYSNVGAMRFPGVEAQSLDILNDELDKRRKSFTSTGVAVREANMNAATSKQIPKENSVLGLMRKGVSYWNSAQVWLGDKLDIANRLMGGRTLRMPIGAAAAIAANSTAELAPSSITTTALTTLNAEGQRQSTIKVDVNGVLVPVPGTKLRVLGPVKFVPSWVSEVTGTSRGMIYENYDEYPTRRQPASLKDLMTEDQWQALQGRLEAKKQKADADKAMLANFNVIAAAGGILQDIAGVVQALRTGYGAIMTARNFVENPLGVASSALGLTPQNIKYIGEGFAQGQFIPGISEYVGKNALDSWARWKDRVASQDVHDLFSQGVTSVGKAKIGDVYNSNEYIPESQKARLFGGVPMSESYAYEMAYGSNDYTNLINSQEAQDAETLAAEGDLPDDVDRTEPNADKVKDSLDEVYGNTDSASYGEGRDDPSTIEEVYGQEGTIENTEPSDEERAALLEAAYGSNTYVSNLAQSQSEDTSGITSTEDEDASIDPVV